MQNNIMQVGMNLIEQIVRSNTQWICCGMTRKMSAAYAKMTIIISTVPSRPTVMFM